MSGISKLIKRGALDLLNSAMSDIKMTQAMFRPYGKCKQMIIVSFDISNEKE